MKKLILNGFMLLALATGVKAQKGSILVYGNVEGQSTKYAGGGSSNQFTLTPGVGYQFNNNWTLGAELGMSTANHAYPSYHIGPFIRYSQPVTSLISIYEQFGAGYTHIGEVADGIYGGDQGLGSGNGFYATLSLPSVFINIKNSFGINFGFGNAYFTTIKPQNGSSNSTVGLKFGNGLSLGISKNF